MFSINQIIDMARNSAKHEMAESYIDSIILAADYAEPGYTKHIQDMPILFANWNRITRWDSEKRQFVTLDDTMPRLAAIIERMGCKLEWNDEWVTCDYCGNAFRCRADGYGWKQSGIIDDGECVCEACIDPVNYLESIENRPRKAVTMNIDPAKHSYTRIDEQFENGLYGGQAADPELVADALRKQGITRFVFTIDSVGQFDLDFSVWLHDSEMRLFDQSAFDSSETNGVDPAEMAKLALQSAPIASHSGEGVQYTKIDCQTGEANTRIVSPQEFIDGIKD